MTGAHAIAHGDVLATLRDLPENEFDALLCDPPYGFRFMGKAWDYDVPSVDVWREAHRVLKPGAALMAFGGARTFHRIATGIEEAGFELRDCLAWMYGVGFPKSLNVAKAIDKRRDDTGDVRGVCRVLRSAMEARGITARQLGLAVGVHASVADRWAARDTNSQPGLPTWKQWLLLKDVLSLGDELDAEVARLNARKGQPGDAWKDAPVVGQAVGVDTKISRLGFSGKTFGGAVGAVTYELKAPNSPLARQWVGYGTALKPAWEPIILARKPLDGSVVANVTKWGTGAIAIDACRIGTESMPKTASGGRLLSPNTAMSGGNYTRVDAGAATGRWPANVCVDEEAAALLDSSVELERVPSRFFYCAKVSTKEREYGCDALPERRAVDSRAAGEDESPLARRGSHNHHPTLKPIALAKWLATMIRPPTDGATLLVPYSGAGSEMIGALQAGWPFVFGIEGDADYIAIAHARLAAWSL